MKQIFTKYKYSILAVIFTLLAIFATATLFNRNYEVLPNPDLQTNLTSQELGNISMADGIRKITFRYTNTTKETLTLTNLYTSCMCTKAKIEINKQQSAFAGMKGHTKGLKPINPNMQLKPGETVIVHAEFDPNAHGPEATGPITRSIILQTNNPTMPQIEFTFYGTVTK